MAHCQAAPALAAFAKEALGLRPTFARLLGEPLAIDDLAYCPARTLSLAELSI